MGMKSLQEIETAIAQLPKAEAHQLLKTKTLVLFHRSDGRLNG